MPSDTGGDGGGHERWGRPYVVSMGWLQPQGLHREDEREHRCDLEPLVQTPRRQWENQLHSLEAPPTCSDLQGSLREVSERTTTYSFNRPGRLSELDGQAQVPGRAGRLGV